MRVLTLFNEYRSLFNGEQSVVHRTVDLIRDHGGESELWVKSSRDLKSTWDKAGAFFSGVYSFAAKAEMRRKLEEFRPDVVHAHNLYPLFSPSVLAACRAMRVPVVMSLHNQNLTCPTSAHLYKGSPCERCFGGREYHCVLRNCRDNWVESVGYALRSGVARRLRLFRRNVTRFIALSRYARGRLVQAGFAGDRVVALPNMVDIDGPPTTDPAQGAYIGFAGRLSPEKGVDTLLEAARRVGAPLKIAGDGPQRDFLHSQKPSNVEFVGRLPAEQMGEFYRNARFIVLSSTAFEMCPLVVSEAMSYGAPVIASRIGGVDELVDDGATGLLFQPGDARDLAEKMSLLWNQPALCRELGRAGFDKAEREYGETSYVRRLIEIYQDAITEVRGAPLEWPPGRQPSSTSESGRHERAFAVGSHSND